MLELQDNKILLRGPRHVVTWALGHLVELAEVTIKKILHLGSWKGITHHSQRCASGVIRQTAHQFKPIRQLAQRRDLHELSIATRRPRGELVARWIMELLPWHQAL